ncbi:hypothetical protein BH09BAC1_BH09BAC1_03310 [soil metagenome]
MDTRATDSKVIIYDDSCPMCAWYTGIFINNQMLPPHGRIGFTEIAQSHLLPQLDLQRARHEIPLIDTNGGATLYGLDAMVHVIGSRFPLVKHLLRIRPVYAFFQQFYHFISYNRRVIAGTAKSAQGIDCTPDVNLTYRSAYLVFAFMVSLAIGFGFASSLSAYLPLPISSLQTLVLVGSSWALALLPGIMWMPTKKLDYMGNQVTVVLIGSLSLLPGMVIQSIAGPLSIGIPMVSVVFSLGLMLWEHFRRVRNLAFGSLH